MFEIWFVEKLDRLPDNGPSQSWVLVKEQIRKRMKVRIQFLDKDNTLFKRGRSVFERSNKLVQSLFLGFPRTCDELWNLNI